MIFKFLLYLFIFYVVFKLIKWFFKSSPQKNQTDPKVRNTAKKTESIRKEDIIEASFEEIKTEEKDKV